MIQYLVVNFREQRGVLANDIPVGFSNTLLRLPADAYQITLVAPLDFWPLEGFDILLGGTTEQQPRVVGFL